MHTDRPSRPTTLWGDRQRPAAPCHTPDRSGPILGASVFWFIRILRATVEGRPRSRMVGWEPGPRGGGTRGPSSHLRTSTLFRLGPNPTKAIPTTFSTRPSGDPAAADQTSQQRRFLLKDVGGAKYHGIADPRESFLATRTSQVHPPSCARNGRMNPFSSGPISAPRGTEFPPHSRSRHTSPP
jgi:hypothetical protein